MEKNICNRILLTAIGSVSSKVVCENIRKKGNVRIYGCDIYPEVYLSQAPWFDVFYQVPKVSEHEAYWACIKKICLENKIDVVVPLIDVEVDFLNQHRNWFKEKEIILAMTGSESVLLARDKKEMMDFVGEQCLKGIKTIPTYYINSKTEANTIQFPVVCKPADGRSSQGLRIIETKEELFAMRTVLSRQKYVVEPYICGNRIVVDVLRNANYNECVAVARKELISTPHGCGLSVYVYRDVVLEHACMELAEKMHVNGCVNYEFLQDEKGDYYFLECNPRFSAGVVFSAMAGYDFVCNHLRCFRQEHIDDFDGIKEQYIARNYVEYVTGVKDE